VAYRGPGSGEPRRRFGTRWLGNRRVPRTRQVLRHGVAGRGCSSRLARCLRSGAVLDGLGSRACLGAPLARVGLRCPHARRVVHGVGEGVWRPPYPRPSPRVRLRLRL
jgi:hypothetical protein